MLFGRDSQEKKQKGLEELMGMLLHAEANIKSLGPGKIEVNTPVFCAEIPVDIGGNYTAEFLPLTPASPVYSAGAVSNLNVYFTNFDPAEHKKSVGDVRKLLENELEESYNRMERVGAAIKVIAEATDPADISWALDRISQERGTPIEYRMSPASFYAALLKVEENLVLLEQLKVEYAAVLRKDITGVLERNALLKGEQRYIGPISSTTAANWILAYRTSQQRLAAQQPLQGA